MWTFGIDKPQATFALNLALTASLPKCIQRGTRVDRLDPMRPDKVCYVIDIIDEDVWEQLEAAAQDPKKTSKNPPRFFAQVLNWRSGVANACLSEAPATKAKLLLDQNIDDSNLHSDGVEDYGKPINDNTRPRLPHLNIDPSQIVLEQSLLKEIYNTYQQATQKQTIPITEEMLTELEAQITRTGKGPDKIIIGMHEIKCLPKGMTHSKIKGWRIKQIATVVATDFRTVISYLKEQPDKFVITTEKHADLEAHITRTGQGPRKIITGMHETKCLPKGLPYTKIQGWRDRSSITAVLEEFMAVLNYLKGQPNLKIAPEKLEELEIQIIRTGSGPNKIITGMREAKCLPAGMNAGKVRNWRNGEATTALPEEVESVISYLKGQPNGFNITPEMRAELEGQIIRTGQGVTKIITGICAAKCLPKGITAGKIKTWRTGKVTTALAEDFTAVMGWLTIQPTANIEPNRRQAANTQGGSQIIPSTTSAKPEPRNSPPNSKNNRGVEP